MTSPSNDEASRRQGVPWCSVYGGGKVGFEITGGVDLGYEGSKTDIGAIDNSLDIGFYNLSTGYSAPTGSNLHGNANELDAYALGNATSTAVIDLNPSNITEAQKKSLRYDPDVLGLGDGYEAIHVRTTLAEIEESGQLLNRRMLTAISCSFADGESTLNDCQQVRRLNALGSQTLHPTDASWDGIEDTLYMVFIGTDALVPTTAGQGNPFSGGTVSEMAITFPLADNFTGDPAGRAAAMITCWCCCCDVGVGS